VKRLPLLLLCACRTEPAPVARVSAAPSATVAPPIIDELAYFDELTAKRPDVIANDCYDALTLKPKYRDALLRDHDSVAAIHARASTNELRARDDAWARSMQTAELAFCAEHGNSRGCVQACASPCAACPATPLALSAEATGDVAPSGYSLCDFVGYQVGQQKRARGTIRDWKVFFELRDDYTEVLTPRMYLDFSEALAREGFHGDSKMFMHSGRVRFSYNGVIIHASSPDDARIAERVGLRVLGSLVVARARGLDLMTDAGELDWHHYLCAHGKDGIPPEGLAFVRY
jgi:hypothetical protein